MYITFDPAANTLLATNYRHVSKVNKSYPFLAANLNEFERPPE